MKGLGLESDAPMLGYLYDAKFGDQNSELIRGFYSSINAAKSELLVNDSAWEELRPLMKAENEAIYNALINGYRDGIPSPLSQQQVEDAVSFYEIIDRLKPYPVGDSLNQELFYKANQ